MLNNIFKAGLVLGKTVIADKSKEILSSEIKNITKKFTSELLIEGYSVGYKPFLGWMEDNYPEKFTNVKIGKEEGSNYIKSSKVLKERCFIIYKEKYIYIEESKGTEKEDQGLKINLIDYKIKCVGNSNILIDFINDIVDWSKIDTTPKIIDKPETHFYSYRTGNINYDFKTNARFLDKIILPAGVKKEITNSIERWIEDSKILREKGLGTTLSHLYYGVPGSGKSSIISIIAAKYNIAVLIIDIDQIKDFNLFIKTIRNTFKDRVIIVIEEIDTYFRKDRKKKSKKGLGFSDILNLLSGMNGLENVMFMITTNYIDKLNPALIRAGRVDLKVEFKLPTLDMVNRYIKLFYELDYDLDLQLEKLPNSMALLERLCINNLHDIDKLLIELKEYDYSTEK